MPEASVAGPDRISRVTKKPKCDAVEHIPDHGDFETDFSGAITGTNPLGPERTPPTRVYEYFRKLAVQTHAMLPR